MIDTQTIIQDLKSDVVKVEVYPNGDVSRLGLEAVPHQLLHTVPGTEDFMLIQKTYGVGVKSFYIHFDNISLIYI